MNRRRFLASAGALAAVFGAGCLGDDPADSPGTGTPSADPTGTDSPSPTSASPTASPSPTAISPAPTDGDRDGRPTVTEYSSETVETGCLNGGEPGIEVSIGDATVDVTGVAETPTPCYEAVIESAGVKDGKLLLGVGLERDDSESCVQCVGAVTYAATVTLDTTDGIDTVTVRHGDDGDRYTEKRDGDPTGSPTDGPQGTPLDDPASDPDPDLQVSLDNEHDEAHQIQVEIRRENGETVYADTHEIDADSERDIYNLREASQDGVEQFTIEASMRGETESMRVETSTCYGDAIISVSEDGELYPYYAIC